MSKLNLKKIVLVAGLLCLVGLQAQALQIKDYPTFLNIRAGMTLTELVSMVFGFLLMVAGLAAFLMIIWGGINYLISVGDPSKMGDAKDQVFKAILGLVIIFTSWMILNTINPQLVELKEPGTPGAKPPGVVPKPVVVGGCVSGTDYDVKLYPQKNYQPAQSPSFCFNTQESKDTMPNFKQIWSVQINQGGIAVNFFDEQNFQGRDICFKYSYGNIGQCPRGGILNWDKWPDSVRSVKVIKAEECVLDGITLNQDGQPVSTTARCPGF